MTSNTYSVDFLTQYTWNVPCFQKQMIRYFKPDYFKQIDVLFKECYLSTTSLQKSAYKLQNASSICSPSKNIKIESAKMTIPPFKINSN